MKKVFFWIISFSFICNLNAQWVWQSPLPTGNTVFSIDFVDPYHGFAFDGFTCFIKSEDGGNNWQVTYNLSLFDSMVDLDFTNPYTGWMVGDKIIKSEDAGETWTVQHQLEDTLLMTVCFINDDYGWAAGEEGLILHTDDGGVSWLHQYCGTNEDLRCIFFIDLNHGWAITSDPLIFATTDGGETWSEQSSGLTQGGYFTSICFADSLNGWIVGWLWSGEGFNIEYSEWWKYLATTGHYHAGTICCMFQ